MHDAIMINKVLIVIAVLLFFALGVAILILMDHKARMKGGFKDDLLTISGLRRDHPIEAFITMTILVGIILSLVLSLVATMGGKLGLFTEKAKPGLLVKLGEQRMVEKMRHFHNIPPGHFEDLGTKNICFQCHGDYPHSKEPMIRTLMNMHTQFIGCMTCHVNPKKIPEKSLSFQWLNYSGIEVKGPPFGTDLDPKSGNLVDTDDYYSKIVVYTDMNGNKELLEMPEYMQEVQDFMKIREKLSSKDKEALKKRFHKPVMPKGRFCTRCHTEENESYIPYQKLGFSKQRIGDLTNMNLIGLVQKYKQFYMPNLLGVKKSASSPKKTGTNSVKKSTSTKNMEKDPRAWWKEMYDAPTSSPGH